MFRLNLIALTMTLATSTANAQDWNGFYFGAQAGFSSSDSEYSVGDGIGFNGITDIDASGASLGLFAGYNHTLSSGVVLGGEVDLNLSSAGSGTEQVEDANTGVPLFGFSAAGSMRAAGSARMRVGYDSGQFLPYVTAGLAVASYEVEAVVSSFDVSDVVTLTGWTAGLGMEYALNSNVSVRAQYLYSDYGSVSLQDNAIFPAFEFDLDSLTSHDLTLGVSYRF